MTLRTLRFLIHADLYRYTGGVTPGRFLKNVLVNPGFKYTMWMRICAYCRAHAPLRYTLLPFTHLIFAHYMYKYGIALPYETQVGSGLQIGHFGGIVVNEQCTIGKNCNLSHGVTIGRANRGRKAGVPTIGDNVFIGPGARILGKITIGNHAAVGANCVVTDDVPDHGVVAGIPGRVISMEGSEGYINRTDYDRS